MRITRATIRERVSRLDEFPRIGLGEVHDAFERWGLPCAAFDAAPEALASLPLPLLAVLDDPDSGQEAAERTLVVIAARDAEGVAVLHPWRGREHLPWRAMAARCPGPYLAAVASPEAEEPNADVRIAAEHLAAAAYAASVRCIPDFLTPDECTRIIAACEDGGLFAPSPVLFPGAPRSSRRSDLRTSATARLAGPGRGVWDEVYGRAAALLATGWGSLEPLQCVRYDPGQRFHAHFDGLGRTHTVLIYLNQGFEGGETFFPDLPLSIAPRAGMAVVFANLDDGGVTIPWSLHAGLPPRGGRKYACNLWVRSGT